MSARAHNTNTEYLAAAVNWVRMLLERKIAQQFVAVDEDERRGCNLLARRAEQRSFDESALKHAAAELERASAAIPSPALITLAVQLGLTPFERDLLLLCAAMEFDTRIPGLCARAHDDTARAYPTFALALSLFNQSHWDALAPERPLRYWRLIEIHQSANQTVTSGLLRADERIVNMIKGLNHLDERLSALMSPLNDPGEPLPPSHADIAARIVHDLSVLINRNEFAVVQLIGSDSPSKHLIAAAAAHTFGLIPYRVRAEHLSAPEIDLIARLWARETELSPLCLLVEAQDIASNDAQAGLARRLLHRARSVVFLDVRELWGDDSGTTLLYDISRPTPTEQRSAWAAALNGAEDHAPAALAGQFDLNMPTIQRIAQIALADTDESPLLERLWDACLQSSRPRLEMLAQRIDARADWTQLVLPDEETRLLHQIAAQVGQRSRVYDEWGFRAMMNRGLGISVLFAGSSGTGKTMAAEVIARDLRLNLYKIDLSAVVSKYIGETEKNLRQIFDAAEYGGAILFFDEADALFGKRSEVKDSHDRYANIEINYLLQRIESYRGLAILATNMKSALDTAFLRRLRFIVDFPFPTIAYRKHIWMRAFPPGVPITALDFDRLARFNLAGGHIHSIAINAAFLAANDDPPEVTMAHVLDAARAEFIKLGLPRTEADFVLSTRTPEARR